VKVRVRRDGEEMLFAPLLTIPPELPGPLPAQHPVKP
jgi:hypothetical protein